MCIVAFVDNQSPIAAGADHIFPKYDSNSPVFSYCSGMFTDMERARKYQRKVIGNP